MVRAGADPQRGSDEAGYRLGTIACSHSPLEDYRTPGQGRASIGGKFSSSQRKNRTLHI